MNAKTRHIFLTLLLLLAATSCTGEYGSIKKTLRQTIENREESFANQLQKIELEQERLLNATDERERFEICNNIFNLSRSFKYDIAHRYATESLKIAHRIGDKNLIGRAEASMISTYTSGGLFIEAAEVIAGAKTKGLDDEVKREIYYNVIRYLSDRHDYISQDDPTLRYSKRMQPYIDSLLALPPYDDYYANYARAYNSMVADNPLQIIADLTKFYATAECSPHHKAITAYLLGMAYFKVGDEKNGFHYLMKSTEYDVASAARENLSFKDLAEEFYSRGHRYIAEELLNVAFDDALFYNARHRNLAINALLPVINRQRIETISRQRNILYISLLLITLLGALALWFGIMARQGSEKIHTSKRIIEQQLRRISRINRELVGSNKIKEEYIIESLQKSSEHIKNLDALLRKIEVKVRNRLYDDLQHLHKDLNFKRERESFFADFDHAFLRLFPNFIVEYNSLFKAEDQIIVDEKTELPAEVRIFALMRLGITEVERIAKFLDLSVNTIYTYRTKVKSKTITPKDEFESRILKIRL